MKVAVPSKGPSLADQVDERFGRCRYLLITDGEKVLEVLEEPSAGQSGGAGVRMAQVVVQSGARAVVGAEPGPKAMQVLRPCGVEVFIAKSMSADQALAALRQGRLPRPEEGEADCAEDVVVHGRSPGRSGPGSAAQ